MKYSKKLKNMHTRHIKQGLATERGVAPLLVLSFLGIALFAVSLVWFKWFSSTSDTEQASVANTVSGTRVPIEELQDVTSTTGEGARIQYSAGTTVPLPVNWPADVPVSEPNLTYAGLANMPGGGSQAMVMFESLETVDGVASTYTARVTDNGWTIDSTTQSGNATNLIAHKDDRVLNMYITSDDTGATKVSISVTI